MTISVYPNEPSLSINKKGMKKAVRCVLDMVRGRCYPLTADKTKYIDLQTLLGAAFVTPPSTFATTGGWAVTNLLAPAPLNTDEQVFSAGLYAAFVFDLKFGAVTPLISSPAGSAMVNDGKPIRTRALPTAPRIFPDPAGG